MCEYVVILYQNQEYEENSLPCLTQRRAPVFYSLLLNDGVASGSLTTLKPYRLQYISFLYFRIHLQFVFFSSFTLSDNATVGL
jgi:hypothetical protein